MTETAPADSDATAPSAPPAKPPFHKRWWSRPVAYILVAYAAWCIGLYFFQGKLIFPAYAAPEAPADPRLPGDRATRIEFEIETGGSVEAWFSPTLAASPDNPAPAVIFCHGNAEIIDQHAAMVAGYRKLGCSVLLPEYRGYGRCAGTPSEKGIVADVIRFHDLLAEREDVDASRIIIHGRSLGGGVAAQLAARRTPAVLILESTFTSVAIMAHRYLVPTFIARHPFRTDHVIPELDVPILIFHGTRDRIIPVKHGRQLRDLTPGARYIEYDCGHNDFPGPGNEREYWDEIRTFLVDADIIP